MGDQIIYENGILPLEDSDIFSSKQWLYILDQNAGSYSSGFIQFDGSSLSNNANYLNWSEAYFSIPYLIAVSSADTAILTKADLLATLKNGAFQIINSMSCQIGGKDVLNLTPYLNQFVSYKLMTKFSTNDLRTLGESLLFSPDSVSSVNYVTASGLENNTGTLDGLDSAVAYSGTTGNTGFTRRLFNTGYNSTTSNIRNIMDDVNVSNQGKNRTSFNQVNANAGNQNQVYYIQCNIRLKDISDLFDKLDMPIRGLYCKFQLNMNQGSVKWTSTTNLTSEPNVQGNTFPVMINKSCAPRITTAGPLIVQCGVASLNLKAGGGGIVNSNDKSCRLYVPAYTMNPGAEARYLEVNKVKTIVYDDLQIFQVVNVNPGANVNQILTNGLANPKKLVVIPSLNPAGEAYSITPFLSCTTTEPATSSPIGLSNFQLMLGGQTVLNNTMNYDWEFFLNETRPNSTMNSGLTDGVSNGLINEIDWFYGYRYYVFDLARRRPVTQGVPLSVQIMAKNESLKRADLNCFITYERRLKVDITSGLVEIA